MEPVAIPVLPNWLWARVLTAGSVSRLPITEKLARVERVWILVLACSKERWSMTCAQCPTARLAALASALPDARHSPRPLQRLDPRRSESAPDCNGTAARGRSLSRRQPAGSPLPSAAACVRRHSLQAVRRWASRGSRHRRRRVVN